MLDISKREAQALATIASRLDRTDIHRAITPDDVLDTIKHLGMIQLDTISVVSRSHETALWSRLGNYNLDHLTTLFTGKRELTEYLTHAAALTPTAYLPLVRGMMDRYKASLDRAIHQPEMAAMAARVMERVEREGAVSSRDFEAQPDAQRQGQWESWYGNKPEREVLASLWAHGDLLIALRDRSFTRWYDLPERVAPTTWNAEPPDPHGLPAILLRHAMRALGVATAPWLTDYWRTGGRAYVPNARVRREMDALVAGGEVIPVSIEGITDAAWLDSRYLPTLEGLRKRTGWPTKTTFLSPFDNLIWKRDRMEKLWDMHYRLEIYTPAPKREFGYYTMPILHRGKLVGRIDPSMNRKEGILMIRSIHLQPGVKSTPALARAIAKTLDEFTAFLGGTDWSIVHTDPPELGREIYRS